MSCKYITKKCNSCNNSEDYLVFFKDTETSDLQGYKNYIDFDLQQCAHCGYINNDIETGFNLAAKKVIESDEYEEIYNYDYLDLEVESLDLEYLQSYPANLYECYALIQENTFNYDNALRGYFRAVVLKETIIRRYNQEKIQDLEDLTQDEIKEIELLEQQLTRSIESNINKILEIYTLTSQNNIFNKIINIECLLRFNEKAKAQEVLTEIESKISPQLKDYVNSLVIQRR